MSLADPGDSGFDDRGYARPRPPHRGRGACRRSCRHALATHFGTGPGAGADRRLCRRDDRSACGRRMNRSRAERRRSHSEARPGRGFIIRNSHGTGCPVGTRIPATRELSTPYSGCPPPTMSRRFPPARDAGSPGAAVRARRARCPRCTYAGRRQRATAGKSSGRRRRGDDATTTCGTLTGARHLMASGRRTGVPTMTLPAPQPLCTV